MGVASFGCCHTSPSSRPSDWCGLLWVLPQVPYMPSLGGVNPLTVISHRHAIKRPRAVVTAPTTLESTSLVRARARTHAVP
eukprot:559358-Prymnesium_polylepis.1